MSEKGKEINGDRHLHQAFRAGRVGLQFKASPSRQRLGPMV